MTMKMDAPDYSEAKKAAAQAVLDAIADKDVDALSSALEEHGSYCGMMGDESAPESEEEEGEGAKPTLSIILAKRMKKASGE